MRLVIRLFDGWLFGSTHDLGEEAGGVQSRLAVRAAETALTIQKKKKPRL
jgi:hypothetical protein